MTAEDIDNYKKMVDATSDRLLNLCDQWSRELAEIEKNVGEEIVQKIHSVIGKTQLLRTSKLKHFRGFLSDAEQNTVGKPVKLDDIRGFWETIYIQVEQVEKIFDELDKLKSADYVVEVTVPDGVKKPVKKTQVKKPVVAASSNLRNFISAQRERKKVEEYVIVAEKPTNGHT